MQRPGWTVAPAGVDATPGGADVAPERFTFFWRNHSVFSQHHAGVPFRLHGVRFATAENFMMWRKGQVFGLSPQVLAQIVAAGPNEAKAIGRTIPNYDNARWHAVARGHVTEGNRAKFGQNPAALRTLLDTAGTTLVEASPHDRVWGIGLYEQDRRAQRRETWLGSNWLGEVLTALRDEFLRGGTHGAGR